MIDHFRESLGLAVQRPSGELALAALAVSALAALVLLGLLAIHRVSRGTRAAAAVALGSWLGGACVATAMVRDGQVETVELWNHATTETSLLNEAASRAEAGHTLLALAVLGICSYCALLALGRLASALLRCTPLFRIALPGTLALLTGTLAWGLIRRIDLNYFAVECEAAVLCTEPVISGTVALTDRLRTTLLAGAFVATSGALLVARKWSAPTKGGLRAAAVVFVVGALSWGATRNLGADGRAPLPERRLARVSCGIALASADSVSSETCAACESYRGAPVIELRGALIAIDGEAVPPDALAAERFKQAPRLPSPSVILIDPRSDLRDTVRSLAAVRDRYWRLADLALEEAPSRSIGTRTARRAELPAQCCCILVELVEGTAPDTWEALERAVGTGKLAVGPKAEPSGPQP